MKKKSKKVRVGLVQRAAGPGPEENLKKTLEAVTKAAQQGARIVALQELFRTRYFPQTEDSRYFDLAEPIPGPTTKVLSELARRQKIVIVASLFEKRAEGIYHNTAVVLDADGSFRGKYRKMHIPDDPGFYEKFYFAPGDLGFKTFDTQYGKVGVLVCWDQWFPEAARLTALAGAEIIFYPTAIGWLDKEPAKVRQAQRAAWETLQRSHAVANGVFVAAINRIGQEGKIRFWGNSFAADPSGQVLAKAGDKEEVLLVDCDFSEISKARQGWPFLRDRRIDAYGGLSQRFLEGTVLKGLDD